MFSSIVSLVLSLTAVVVAASEASGKPLSCASWMKDKPAVPCVEVPRCASSADKALSASAAPTLQITQSSTGSGRGKSLTEVDLCFDDTRLYVNARLQNQFFLTKEEQFSQCNDPIFYENVFEAFLAPYAEQEAHCYNELDVSPVDVMFNAGIYSPNLSRTGFVGSDIPCDGDNLGITHRTSVAQNGTSWETALSFPFRLLNCPYNCPLSQYCGSASAQSVYRANFFRINELSPVSKCSSSSCEYLAWNPTLVNPPAFHEPTKFGFLLLQI